MKRANLRTQVQTDKAEISYTLRALRNFPYMGMIVVEMLPKTDCMLEVTNSTVFPGELQETSATYKMLKDGKIELPVYTSQAKSLTGMQDLATCSAFLFDEERPLIYASYTASNQQAMSFNVQLQKGKSYRFALIGSVCSSRDFVNPKNEAERMAVFALQSDIDYFIEGHEKSGIDYGRAI